MQFPTRRDARQPVALLSWSRRAERLASQSKIAEIRPGVTTDVTDGRLIRRDYGALPLPRSCKAG
jgi:hypothetical protein